MPADWNSGTSYFKEDLVTRVGVSWMSLQDANLDNPPESSVGFWLLIGPREQVLRAFKAIVQIGMNMIVERNSPEPAGMVAQQRVLQQLDGEEQEPVCERPTGLILHKTGVELECYVATPDQDPGPFVNDLAERVRAVVLRERDLDRYGKPDPSRVLGSLLYGTVDVGYGLPHFSGLEEGPISIEIFREDGAEHGGVARLEFLLQYAVRPDNPLVIVPAGVEP